MYKSYYNLSEMPFTISTDPRFLWLGEKHLEALANLKYGLVEADGYVVLTGDVGVGKTTLVNALLDGIDDSILTVNISHPTLSIMEFFRFLAKSWGGPADLDNKTEFLFFFEEFLFKAEEEGKKIVLIIDEAHQLSEELLEEIRLLTNIEQKGKRLINIFFVGQDELKDILMYPQFRALRQRITLFYDIKPLTRKETAEYIKHRLKIADGDSNLFNEEAVGLIHQFSKGYPRLINTLCGRAMLTGYIQEKQLINAEIIAECSRELDYLDPTLTRQHHVTSHASSSPEQHVSQNASIHEGSEPEPQANITEKNETTDQKLTEYRQSMMDVLNHWRQWLSLSANKAKALLLLILVGILSFYLLPDRNGSFAKLEQENDKIAEMTEAQEISPGEGKLVEGMTPTEAKSTEGMISSEKSISVKKENEQNQMTAPPAQTESEIGDQDTEKVAIIQQETKKRIEADQIKKTVNSPPAPPVSAGPTTLELASAAFKKQKYQTVIDLLEGENNTSDKLSSESLIIYAGALVGKAEQSIADSPQESKELLRKAVEIDNANSRAYFLLGKIYTKDKEYALAIEAYQTAGSLDPDFADSFFNLGFLYATTGMYEKSEQFFQRVVELQPDYLGKALFNLAVVQDRMGKLEASISNLRKASDLNPENQKVQSYLQKAMAKRKG